MGRKPNPALIGGFVVGAVALAVAGLMVFGGGKFFRARQAWVAHFDESIKGLAVGAPVTFRGIRIGTVTEIKVVVDPKTMQIRTPVYFQILSERITDTEGRQIQLLPGRTGPEALIERGLRARLEMQSFVTGQLAIDFDFYPGTPVKLSGVPAAVPEFPTVPSAMSAFGRGLQDLNIAEVVRDLQETMRGISRIVNGPEIRQALASGSQALQGVDRLAANADRQIAALGPALSNVSEKINEALGAIQALARRVDAETVPAVTATVRDAQQLLRRVDAETVPAVNQALSEVRPLLLEAVKTASAARSALEQAQKALESLDGSLDAGSPLQYQLRTTLQEVSAAARAVRVLSGSLERHPEALLQGKGGK